MPVAVRVTAPLRERSNTGAPIRDSKRLICWLTADCVRLSRLAATENPPVCCTNRKARSRSISRSGRDRSIGLLGFMMSWGNIINLASFRLSFFLSSGSEEGQTAGEGRAEFTGRGTVGFRAAVVAAVVDACTVVRRTDGVDGRLQLLVRRR